MINYIALIVALGLSGVSGYYSIIGLTAIFSSAFYPILFMGIVLELGKLVTASWLYNNWRYCPFLLKSYLTISVIILMFITSMGIFGFLSKAHIEQTLNLNSGASEQIKIIDSKIEFEKRNIEDIEKQIAHIDTAISEMTKRGRASASLKAADQQRKTRGVLVSKKDEYVKNISTYTQQRIKFESEIRRLEAEIGPLKYISELIYQEQTKENLERSVRMVIIILVLVFDPLAVLLLIAANVGIRNRKKHLTGGEIPGILEIDDRVLNVGGNDVVKR